MNTSHRATLLVFCMVLLASRTAFAQPLTAEDVVETLEGEAFVSSMSACVEGREVPETLTLVVQVDEEGKANLGSTTPPVPPDLKHCIGVAVATLELRASGQACTIEYEYVVRAAEPEPGPEQELPSEGVGEEAAAQPGAPQETGAEDASAAPQGDAGPQAGEREAQPRSEEPWLREYRAGKAMTVAGTLLTVLGAGTIVASGLYALITLIGCPIGMCDRFRAIDWEIFLIVDLAALGVLVTGIAVLVTGIVKRTRASRALRSLSLGGIGLTPTPHGDGAVLSAVWRY